jgi:endonuclease I
LPADAHANSVRGSYDFGEVTAPRWECDGGAKCGSNGKGRHVFEPPDGDKGRVARATLYMASVYDLALAPRQVEVLRRWSNHHPPDALERQHNERASDLQGNRNPFVDQPELVNRLPW